MGPGPCDGAHGPGITRNVRNVPSAAHNQECQECGGFALRRETLGYSPCKTRALSNLYPFFIERAGRSARTRSFHPSHS